MSNYSIIQVVELLRQRSRPYLFSNTMPPAVVGSAIKVFELLEHSAELPELVDKNTKHFR